MTSGSNLYTKWDADVIKNNELHEEYYRLNLKPTAAMRAFNTDGCVRDPKLDYERIAFLGSSIEEKDEVMPILMFNDGLCFVSVSDRSFVEVIFSGDHVEEFIVERTHDYEPVYSTCEAYMETSKRWIKIDKEVGDMSIQDVERIYWDEIEKYWVKLQSL